MSEDAFAPGLFDRIRAAAAEVARRARLVRIDDGALEQLAGVLSRERPKLPAVDPAHARIRDDATTLAFVVTMNAINFGSGWFPHVRKRDGLSGYLTFATTLRERFDRRGAWRADELEGLDADALCDVFRQPREGPARELVERYAEALNQLGRFLNERHRGRFAGPIERANRSAERLVQELARMPFYRDVASYQDVEVPFYKRAQITASDLAQAFDGDGLGRFDDADALTLFADNLVPHTLRMFRVLVYDLQLETPIDLEREIPAGSEAEVEIRAVGLHAVERLAESCQRRGWRTTPHELDHLLWSRGQSPQIKAKPRHRTRCTFY